MGATAQVQTLTENNDSANIESAIPIGPNMITQNMCNVLPQKTQLMAGLIRNTMPR